MDKKADGIFWYIIAAALALIVLVVIAVIFGKGAGQGASTTDSKLQCLNKDTDSDGVNDLIDKCCTKGGDVGIDGCPKDTEESDYKACDC